MIMMTVGREPSRVSFPSICRLNESIELPVGQSCCVSAKLLPQGNEEGLSEWWRRMMKTISVWILTYLAWYGSPRRGRAKSEGECEISGKRTGCSKGTFTSLPWWLFDNGYLSLLPPPVDRRCSPYRVADQNCPRKLKVFKSNASCVSREKVDHSPKLLCSQIQALVRPLQMVQGKMLTLRVRHDGISLQSQHLGGEGKNIRSSRPALAK